MTVSETLLIAHIILLNTGAILGMWGLLWRMWDNRANAPAFLMAYGIVALMLGGALA